jgi:hypothetical protein
LWLIFGEKHLKMYNIIHKKNVLQRYRTKREAQRELDDRAGLCYMLRVKPSEAYSIKKGRPNAARREGVEGSMR